MRRSAATIAALLVVATGCDAGAGRTDRPAGEDRAVGAGGTGRLDDGTTGSSTCDSYTLIGIVRARRVDARLRPGDERRVLASFGRVNEQGAQQVFPLIDEREVDGDVWYEAMLPMRPNGTTGWIPASAIELGRTDYRIEVDLDRFRLDLFERCDRVATYPIGLGTEDTPTPRGTFFLNSLLQPPDRGSVYGAYAFGLSAYSEVIFDWEGGGIVGLHGTNDPSSIGRRVSHGCIRMRNEAIRFLARTVPLGTTITIE